MTDDLTKNETLNNNTAKEAPIAAILKNSSKPFEKMTVKELRELCMQIPGVVGASGMRKEELLNTIYSYMEHVGSPLERSSGGKAKKAPKSVKKLTPADLKKKIVVIREKKLQALEADDSKKANAMRRRINRLKKQSRKIAKKD